MSGTIDEEGWVHTGDIVHMRPNGSIKIIDRIKNIFKLA
jgi:long-chain acyl-CoA synthetase